MGWVWREGREGRGRKGEEGRGAKGRERRVPKVTPSKNPRSVTGSTKQINNDYNNGMLCTERTDLNFLM